MTTLLVVAGASGDLFSAKVAPALARLHGDGTLDDVSIVGASRRPWGDDDFRSHVRVALERAHVETMVIESFLPKLSYASYDISDESSADALVTWLAVRRAKEGIDRVVLYLSVSPTLYAAAFRAVAKAASSHAPDARTWLSLVVEKPYGTDEAHAAALDAAIEPALGTDAVYRIDHYLTKETLQDILAFRFANRVFEASWSAAHVARIRVCAFETATVGDRGAFYDATGALRDVGQNHLLQMLSAVTMDEPRSFDVDEVRSRRAEPIERLAIDPASVRLGQYDGYLDSKGVAPDSGVETFFRATATIDSDRWRGVPIEFSAGKALDRKETYVEVEFKPSTVDFSRFEGKPEGNVVRFELYPHERVSFRIFGKRPGVGARLAPRQFGYSIQEGWEPSVGDVAYVAVMAAALAGDRLSFAGSREVRAAWRFVDAIRLSVRDVRPTLYTVGTRADEV